MPKRVKSCDVKSVPIDQTAAVPTDARQPRTDAPSILALVSQAPLVQHPYGQIWQPLDDQTFQELVDDIRRRGLDKDIVRYQEQILEGWHRYLACLATNTIPQFVEFQGTDIEAAELVHASGIRRQANPDQRYAAFVMLCDACPEFGAKYERLKEQGQQQQKAGKPLATGSQRVDVVKERAKAAGVSKATAQKVERVKKANPDAVADIAAGKTTANQELQRLFQRAQRKIKGEKPNPNQTKPPNYRSCNRTQIRVTAAPKPSPGYVRLRILGLASSSGSSGHTLDILLDHQLAHTLSQQLMAWCQRQAAGAST